MIAIDVDGTLLNDKNEITPEVKQAIRAARRKGVKVVLCTGRPMGGVHGFLAELNMYEEDEYAITYNGALVQNIYTNEPVQETALHYEDLEAIYELSQIAKAPMHFLDAETVYTFDKDIHLYTILEAYECGLPLCYRTIEEIPKDIQIPKMMFVGNEEEMARIIPAIPDFYKEKYNMVLSSPYFMEILHKSASKGTAVMRLAERLSIQREEIICIGDSENDLSMIECAGLGVAMGNAVPSVKAAAKFHTLSNKENGVAYAIEKLVLNKD